jgi:hypothetical protein
MDGKPTPSLKPDPEHLRQVGLQIWLPLTIALAVILGLAVLAIVLTAADISPWKQWADLSIIWLVFPLCLCNLVMIALLAGLVFVTYKAKGGLLPFMRKTQIKVEAASQTVQKLADKAVRPVIKVKGWGAGWQAVKERIGRIFKR